MQLCGLTAPGRGKDVQPQESVWCYWSLRVICVGVELSPRRDFLPPTAAPVLVEHVVSTTQE